MRSSRPQEVRTPAPVLVLTVLLAALLLPRIAAAQTPDEEARRRALAQRMVEARQPGPEHQRLAALEGSWDATVSFRGAAAEPPQLGRGSATNRMILDGRFLHSRPDTLAGSGLSLPLAVLGHDRRSNRYTISVYASWATHSLTAEGLWDAGSRAITMYGNDDDFLANRTDHYTVVLRLPNPDEYILEISRRTPSGESVSVSEVRYTRRR